MKNLLSLFVEGLEAHKDFFLFQHFMSMMPKDEFEFYYLKILVQYYQAGADPELTWTNMLKASQTVMMQFTAGNN